MQIGMYSDIIRDIIGCFMAGLFVRVIVGKFACTRKGQLTVVSGLLWSFLPNKALVCTGVAC